MNRKEFLELSAGIIGGLGIPGVIADSARAAETESSNGAALDDSYLVRGLTGMVRAEGWFDAHWGAGVLAGYYLCRDNHLGEEALATPLPDLPATLYLEFARNGNRSRFEARHKARRQMLHYLILAECVEARGRFLDAIANAAWAICEESSWCYPAHISAQAAGGGLPDVNEPIVDLFAAETAVSLSWTLYLLDDELDLVSPRLRPRLAQEIDHRILTPFLERDDFGWMGFYQVTRTHRPNNWNPWINASVLTASLLVEPVATRRGQLVHKVLRSVDRFLLAYPADGSCDEGPGYWGTRRRLTKVWGPRMNRILLEAKAPRTQGTSNIRIKLDP